MRLTSIGLLVPAACLLAGGIAFAAGAGVHKQKADTIRACARKQDGRLRMVASAANCKRGERADESIRGSARNLSEGDSHGCSNERCAARELRRQLRGDRHREPVDL